MRSSAIIIMGPPSSGKGTVAREITGDINFPIITPGDIYKALREEDSDLGRLVKESLKDGGYCPDWLTNQIMTEESEKLIQEGAKGIIFDGYPRTFKQLTHAMMNFDIVGIINIQAPYEEIYDAAMNRIACAGCGFVYSLKQVRPECCPAFRFAGVRRWDDTEEFFPKRYDKYQTSSAPLVDAVCDLKVYGEFKALGNENVLYEIKEFLRKIRI